MAIARSVSAQVPRTDGRGVRETQRLARRDEILRVFTEHVARLGYDGTNLADIAAELDISKGTIVHHFGTKLALLEIQHVHYMRRRIEHARLILSRLERPSERLAGLIAASMLALHREPAASGAFAREVNRFRSADFATSRGLREEFLGFTVDTIDEGVDSGEFRPCDTPIVALQLQGAVNWSWHWYHADGRRGPYEIASELARTMLGGLLVRDPAPPVLDLERIEAIVEETFNALESLTYEEMEP